MKIKDSNNWNKALNNNNKRKIKFLFNQYHQINKIKENVRSLKGLKYWNLKRRFKLH